MNERDPQPLVQAPAAGGSVKRGYVRALDFKHGRVDLSHGSGGRAMAQLIDELFARSEEHTSELQSH